MSGERCSKEPATLRLWSCRYDKENENYFKESAALCLKVTQG
jgi:hypothetical protein